MRIYEVSAFTRDGKGGNKAGVALLYNEVSEGVMQEIAADLKYSETAFVIKEDQDTFNVRFFTPTEEVDLCGHATIATFSLLNKEELFDGKNPKQFTKAGKLNIVVDGETILMEMATESIGSEANKEDVANLLGISVNDIIETPQFVGVGLMDCMVLVKDRETLKRIVMIKQEMIEYSNENNITGFHVCAIENGVYYVRNFGPACGIDEESATGTANGAMYVYLRSKGLINSKDTIEFMQGDFMDSPSSIIVSTIDNKIWVGGKATINKEKHI